MQIRVIQFKKKWWFCKIRYRRIFPEINGSLFFTCQHRFPLLQPHPVLAWIVQAKNICIYLKIFICPVKLRDLIEARKKHFQFHLKEIYFVLTLCRGQGVFHNVLQQGRSSVVFPSWILAYLIRNSSTPWVPGRDLNLRLLIKYKKGRKSPEGEWLNILKQLSPDWAFLQIEY